MNYEALIFDLDGTAITNGENVLPTQRVVSAVTLAKKKLKLCAATGRPITNSKQLLEALGLTDPCIISGGTQIIEPTTGEILWEVNLETGDAERVLEICRPYPYELLFKEELIGEGGLARVRAQPTSPINVMYVMGCTGVDAEKIIDQLDTIPTITASGVTSWTGPEVVDIHITHRSATKEHAVGKLLEMLGVEKALTVGVGDGNNDIHLFQAVGHRVAMGNATELLKSQADEVCDTVENDGLAKLIEELLAS